MNYNNLAKEILKKVGGDKNVISLVHCATRLRFRLKDDKKILKEELEGTEGVLYVVQSSGQLQVVLGPDVSNVYKAIMELFDFKTVFDPTENQKETIVTKIFDIVSGSLSPLISVFAGAGMIKAFLLVLQNLHLLSDKSGTYAILSAAGNAIFYFLPIMLGVTSSIKLGANPYIGAAIGAALLEPNFTSLLEHSKTTSFMGLPVVLMNYSSSVFPIFIAICIFAILEKGLKKVISNKVQLFLVPMLSLMIMVPLTVMVFGPFGVYFGNVLGAGISFLIGKSAILAGAVIGASWVFMVMLGLHWAFVPIVLANIGKGYDLIIPMTAVAAAATFGIAFGTIFRSKDKDLRTLAGSALLSGVLSGVTEPILYGIILRYKRTIVYLVIAGAFGGAVMGLLGVKLVAFTFFINVFTIPLFSPVLKYLFAFAVAFGISTTLTVVFGLESVSEKSKENSNESLVNREVVASPLTGEIRNLAEVKDKVFSMGIIGRGVAIEPTVGQVVAPVDGTISAVYPSGHAVAIKSEQGAEILIHIGVDTVQLEGKYFTTMVKQGDQVKQGQLLINFELEKIKQAGYEVITPIVVTNAKDYIDVVSENNKFVVQDKESLLALVV